MKPCPQCAAPLHTAVRLCPHCGYEFPPAELNHTAQAAFDMAILSSQIRPIRHEITDVRYRKHVGKSGIPTLQVDYYSGYVRVASEWVCLEHPAGSYARKKAEQWWVQRCVRGGAWNHTAPPDVDEALTWIDDLNYSNRPSAIHLRPGTGDKKYPEIVRFEWAHQREEEAA
jgi:DNA repair protein RadD